MAETKMDLEPDAEHEEPDRINSKTLMLTYDHLEDSLTEDDVIAHLKCILETKEWPHKKMVWVTEPHENGGYHVHVAILFTKKHNLKDMKAFDLLGWDGENQHPNFKVRKGRDAWNKMVEYVSKSGYAKGDTMIWGYKNYRKEKGDWTEWQQDMKVQHAAAAFPIKWIDGENLIYERPTNQREYIYVIVGDPDTGKSFWVYKNLKPYTYFKVTNGQFPMEGYKKEKIILYDDFDFNQLKCDPQELIIAQGQVYNMDTKAGHARYADSYYAANQANIVIIICNPEKKPAWLGVKRIESRMAALFTTERAPDG